MWNIDLLISSIGWILTGELPAFDFQNIQKDVRGSRTVVRCPDGQQGDFRSRIGKAYKSIFHIINKNFTS